MVPNGLNASADNLIFEQAGGSRATDFSSSVSSLSINVSKIDDEMEGVSLNRKKSQKVVMAGKALVGGASNITAKKKKQRKAKTIDKTAWPFVDEELHKIDCPLTFVNIYNVLTANDFHHILWCPRFHGG